MESGVANDFQDWELLHSSDSPVLSSIGSNEPSRTLDGIEADSGGVIRTDHFSFAFENPAVERTSDVSEDGSVKSDNPSWIDPGPEIRYGASNSGVFLSDSGSDGSESLKLSEFDGNHGLGLTEGSNCSTDSGKNGRGQSHRFEVSQLIDLEGNRGPGLVEIEKSQEDLQVLGEFPKREKGSDKLPAGSGRHGSFSMKLNNGSPERDTDSGSYVETQQNSELLGGDTDEVSGLVVESASENGHENQCSDGERRKGLEANKTVAVSDEIKSTVEERRTAWWKIPFEVVKFCVFRASPIWSLSAAATVMGFIVLGRFLYKMKRKSRNLQLKVTVDDKKVSQFMSHAARLNEAFWVVRRAPIVRPSLPASGVASWPVLSVR